MKKKEIIYRVPEHYVEDDCIQLGIGFQNSMTIVSGDGIEAHFSSDPSIRVHKYLQDERRMQFPYYNIPMHYKKRKNTKFTYVNQLLDFSRPYVIIKEGIAYELYAVKDRKEAFVVHKGFQPTQETKHMTYQELCAFLKSFQNTPYTRAHYVYINGKMPSAISEIIPREREIYNDIKKILNAAEYNLSCECNLNGYPLLKKYLDASIEHLDLSLVPDLNVLVTKASGLLVIETCNGEITKITGIDTTFVRENDFSVNIYDIPISKPVLEQIRSHSKIKDFSEPKIPLNINPHITREDICIAKRMVKEKKDHE